MRSIYFDSLDDGHIDHIQNLILGGSSTTDILETFPHCNKEEVENMIATIARQCWYDDEEWGYFGI